MGDTFTEVTSESWGGRIMGSIKGVLVGLALFAASFVLLFWNEGNTVKTARGLTEVASQVVSIPSDPVDPAMEDKLVHLTGEATTDESLADDALGVSGVVIKLQREVEIYQWEEDESSSSERRVGGRKTSTKTYSYKKVWSKGRVDSSSFKKLEGHENTGSITWPGKTLTAKKVTLGAFDLSPGLVGQIGGYEDMPVTQDVLDALTADVKAKVQLAGSGYYVPASSGASPASPQIGDQRIKFRVVKPQDVSVIAQQVKSTFCAYTAGSGKTFEMLKAGIQTSEAMVAAAKAANKMMAWILRFVGFLLMFFGLCLVAQPLVVVADVVPFLGSLLGLGVALFAGIIAATLSLITIAVAWIVYRPVLGVALLIVAGGVIYMGVKKARARKAG